jgi:hypothetical protein
VRLDESCERVFARHETFHPRYGWIKKAVDAASRDDDLFNRDDAVVEMGVGKNMVKSIRHWGLAFKVLESQAIPGTRRQRLVPSAIGRALFQDGSGADPFMEFPGTDWLMHWLLLAPLSQAPVWWLAFNEFNAIEFSEEQLLQFVLDRVSDFGTPNASSVKKDVNVLLRMYSSGHGVRATFEERIDAPFRELGLLQPSVHEPDLYRFNVGPKPTLPARVFAVAVLDFVARSGSDARVVSLSRALAEPGSPGRVFKLTDGAALDLLRLSAEQSELIRLGASAGMPQLTIEMHPEEAASRLLREHYAEFGSELSWPTAREMAGVS